MKLRHIIMIIILIIAISIFIDNNGVKHLTCTATGTLYESPSVSTLEISIKNDMLKDINISIDINLESKTTAEKNSLIQMAKMQGKSDVTETKNGIRLTSDMNGSYFTSLGLTKNTTFSELKEALEIQGYTCK